MPHDLMVYFDNSPHGTLLVSAVDSHLWHGERIRRLRAETCAECGCKLRGRIETLCLRCAAEVLEEDESDDGSTNG